MTRRALNLLTALSLLLCAGVGVMWGRSYWVVDEVVRDCRRWPDNLHWRGDQYVFTSMSGTWTFAHQRTDEGLSSDPPSDQELVSMRQQMPDGTSFSHRTARGSALARMNTRKHVNAFGFGREHLSGSHGTSRIEFRSILVPAYLPFALTALPPAAWLSLTWRHRQRASQNLCPTCEYDLRGTPERCPECGVAVTRSS
jgi:hypothetical protein